MYTEIIYNTKYLYLENAKKTISLALPLIAEILIASFIYFTIAISHFLVLYLEIFNAGDGSNLLPNL